MKKEENQRWRQRGEPLPVKAEREVERDAGEKALWALVSLGWLWLQDAHQDMQKKKEMKEKKETEKKKRSI